MASSRLRSFVTSFPCARLDRPLSRAVWHASAFGSPHGRDAAGRGGPGPRPAVAARSRPELEDCDADCGDGGGRGRRLFRRAAGGGRPRRRVHRAARPPRRHPQGRAEDRERARRPASARTSTPPTIRRQVGPVDVVLFAVKLWDTEKAAELARPLVGPDTRVITLAERRRQLRAGVADPRHGADHRRHRLYRDRARARRASISHTSKFAIMRCGRIDGKPDAKLAGVRRGRQGRRTSTSSRRTT